MDDNEVIYGYKNDMSKEAVMSKAQIEKIVGNINAQLIELNTGKGV